MIAEVVYADVMKWAAEYDGLPFHAIMCDPPYELNFMSKSWDSTGIAFRPETWAALAEHLLPGAFVFAFGGCRTYHRLACALEDAGLRLHSAIGWIFGSGFPKATSLAVQLDKRAGMAYDEPQTNLAHIWQGHRYGLQALKPALELIAVAQKPYEGRPVDSITATGAGALNVDAGRVGFSRNGDGEWHSTSGRGVEGQPEKGTTGIYGHYGNQAEPKNNVRYESKGRWPPNFALVHSPGCVRVGTRRVKGEKLRQLHHQSDSGFVDTGEDYYTTTHGSADGLETVDDWLCEEGCPVAELGRQSGQLTSGARKGPNPNATQSLANAYDGGWEQTGAPCKASAGTATRFYPQADWSHEIAERLATCAPVRYQAKAGRRERDAGLDNNFPLGAPPASARSKPAKGRKRALGQPRRNFHPTCKPISLCIWLAKLLLPPPEYASRRILIPFAGSGSEMAACVLAGWEEVIGIEMSEEYCALARARLRFWHTWHERGYTDPAEVLRRTAKRKQVDERQLKLKL